MGTKVVINSDLYGGISTTGTIAQKYVFINKSQKFFRLLL